MMQLKPDTTVTRAETATGQEIPVHTDSYLDSLVYVVVEMCGPVAVVVAESWEDALEILIDNLAPIPESEILEAYGYYGDDAQSRFDADVNAERYPDLAEGYYYQDNATGTGIVSLDHTWILSQWTRASGVQLYIERI